MKQRKQKISIIIPIYNGEKYLDECIKSVLSQFHKNIEVILVNDGSTDQTEQICFHYAKHDKRIKVISQSNQGVSSARNNGLRAVTGDFVMFVDADDVIMPDLISKSLDCLEKNEADMVVYGWKRIYNDKNITEEVTECFEVIESPRIAIKRILENYSECGGGYPWNKMWRCASIKEMQFFDEKLFYFEDLEWVIRMISQVNTIVICPECLYQYKIHDGSTSTDSSRVEEKEISYHMSLRHIIDTLAYEPDLQMWIKEKYSPEIVNGILHAKRRGWDKLESFLKEQLVERKQLILKSSRIPTRIKIRCLRVLVFS